MARKTFAFIGILAVLLMSLGMVSATTLAEWTLTTDGIATIVDTNINAGTFASSGVFFNSFGTNGANAENWSIASTINTSKYFEVTISPKTDYTLTISDINFDYSASISANPASFEVKYSKLSNFAFPTSLVVKTDVNTTEKGSSNSGLDIQVSSGETLTLRWFGYNFTADTNEFHIKDLEILGTVTAPTTPPTTTYNFCDDFSGEKGTLEISDFTIVNLGEGDDEEWELLDEIEIEVEVENTDRNDDVDDVMVEIMILDNNDNDVTNDFDIADEEIDLGRIKDDDSEVAVFTIKEIPADLDDGEYKLYFRAYSEGDEDSHCIASSNDFDEDTYQEIEVIRLDSKAVIVKPEWTTVLASCGDKYVEVTLDVYNIGEDKEEKILVSLFNSKLNINEKVVINDLRSGKRQEITFVFDVPENLDDKYYNLDIVTYYDYDDGEDELSEFSYDESSYNDLDKDFSVRLEILSCKGPDPTLTASLESIAEMGTELIVKATITNNDEDNDFIISASDFDAWATMVSIAPQTIFIAKGESAEVLITFNPTTTGSHSFKINTIVGGESYDQSVSVIIEEKPGIFADLDNTTLYIIVGILVVLISIILTVIVKASRRRVKPEF